MAAPTVIKSDILYYKAGSSDKEYQLHIIKQGPNYIVQTKYGRRGQALTSNEATFTSRYRADDFYVKKMDEKIKKGYTKAQNNSIFANTTLKGKATKATTILPQLLNPITAEQANDLLSSDNWWMQQKLDGKRVLIHRLPDGTVKGINRRGIEISIPSTVEQAALSLLANQFIIDGELIGDTLHAFDLLEHNKTNCRKDLYKDRLEYLGNLFPTSPSPTDGIKLVSTAKTTDQKTSFLNALKIAEKEGVVFRRWDSVYEAGRPNSGGSCLKYKFYETATFEVSSISATKRSVELRLYTVEVPNKITATHDVGFCTIPPNHEVPQVGDIVEVRYLYAFKMGSVYQPVYLGVRTDQDKYDCTLDQLKYKSEE